jgi:hypothetical protein
MPYPHKTKPRFILSPFLLKTSLSTLVFSALLMVTQSFALTLKVAWQPSPDTRVTGYRLFYGQSSGSYSRMMDAGGQVSCTLSDLSPGLTYFFAAAAYDAGGNQSDYSEEISYTVPVVSGNNAPTAVNGTLSLTEDGEGTGTLQASDPDGDALTFSIVTPPTRGALTWIDASSGAFRYTPFPDTFGTDSFSFKASDSQLSSNIAKIDLTVGPSDDPPLAVADSAVTTQRTPIVIEVLANDLDADGDSLFIKSARRGRSGRIRIVGKRTILYTPRSRFTGTDTFTYTVSDGRLNSPPATVVVQVLAANTPPAAIDSSHSAQGGATVSAVMHAADPDGDPLEYFIVKRPSKGTVSLTNASTGAFVYKPHAGSSGQDSFTFKVSDGKADSNLASASIDLGASNPVVLAVNAGGPAYVDSQGIHFEADRFHSGGRARRSGAAIDGTADETLYQSERSGSFSYDIPLENGHYLLTLKLAETRWSAPGRRVMNVLVEGRQILSGLDLFSAAGKNHAYDIRLPVQVSDGTLNVGFSADANEAKLSALLVQKLEHGLSYGVNAGGGRLVDAAGFVYEHDALGDGGRVLKTPSLEEGADEQDLLETRRSGDFAYDIPLPDGAYLVTLKFAELRLEHGSRQLFHFKVQDEEVLSSCDAAPTAGSSWSREISTLAVVQDGHLRLSLQSPAEKAQLGAILIEWQE